MTSNTLPTPTARPSILFFHAHPDDEAIFTGGTIARLTDVGVGVTVVIATDDHTLDDNSTDDNTTGHNSTTDDNTTGDNTTVDNTAGPAGGDVRRLEAESAAAALKVDRLEFLGYPDSGLGPNPAPGSFAAISTAEAAERLAGIARDVGATALVTYDPGGIYGHPDHLAAHRVGLAAARLAHVPTVYQATVDREHLHFVATHLVGTAVEALMQASDANRPEGMLADAMARPVDGKLAGGTPTVLIDTTVEVSDVIDRKRAAMAAHVSQIPADSEVMRLDNATFTAVYGHEWYVRSGPPTVLDELTSS